MSGVYGSNHFDHGVEGEAVGVSERVRDPLSSAFPYFCAEKGWYVSHGGVSIWGEIFAEEEERGQTWGLRRDGNRREEEMHPRLWEE